MQTLKLFLCTNHLSPVLNELLSIFSLISKVVPGSIHQFISNYVFQKYHHTKNRRRHEIQFWIPWQALVANDKPSDTASKILLSVLNLLLQEFHSAP